MVTMKNIKQVQNLVYMDCYIEDSKEISFSLCVDPYKQVIVYNSLEKVNAYVSHAAYRIYKIVEAKEELPTEACSIWY